MIFVSAFWLPVTGRRSETVQYILQGTLVPACALGLVLSERRFGPHSPQLRAIKLVLVAACVAAAAVFLSRHAGRSVIVLAAFQLAFALYRLRSQGASNQRAGIRVTTVPKLLVAFFVSAAAWAIALTLIWWEPPRQWFFSSAYGVVVLILGLGLVLSKLWGSELPWRAGPTSLQFAGNVGALAIIAYASLHTDFFFNAVSFHHWSFYIGPAELVRQGGALLWDVPSQYGFLSVLAIAWLPAKSTWESFFILNAVLDFAFAASLFWVIRSRRGDFLDLVGSLAITLAAVFLRSGLGRALTGPNEYPSIGGYRFGWCLLLLALLLALFRRQREKKPVWPLLVAGSGLWLIGTLWSAESALYCAAVWLPAVALLAWGKAREVRASSEKPGRPLFIFIGLLTIPALTLAAALGALWTWYRVVLGHGPDPVAFFDYARAYAGGVQPPALDSAGPVWVLFLVLAALLSGGVVVIQRRFGLESLMLVLGGWAAVWATASYFVSRSHPNNVVNLSPVYCASIFMLFHALSGRASSGAFDNLSRLAVAPILVVLLAGSFGDASGLLRYASTPPQNIASVDVMLPDAPKSLQELLDSAGAQPGDPLVFVSPESTVMPVWNFTETGRRLSVRKNPIWLPAAPLDEVALLPEDRRDLYVFRFIARTRMSGWLVESTHIREQTAELGRWDVWLHDQLSRTHGATRKAENADWTLIWYQYGATAGDGPPPGVVQSPAP